MKKMMLIGCVGALLCASAGINATEIENAVDWKKVAKLEGVQRVKTDSKGRVKSFVVVGSSRVSTVLGSVKGKKIAQKRAQLAAKAEIVKWLKSKVSSIEKSNDETIINLQGDGNKTTESGKSVEYTSSQISVFAEGIIKGMTPIYSAIVTEDNEQEFVVILGWSSKNVAKANQVAKIMQDDNYSEPKAKKKKSKKLLKEEVIISEDASEY